MARIRSIKPEFWDDRKLAKRLSRDARLLYIGLWNQADEHGRLNGDPQWIKGQVFPYDDDIDAPFIEKLLSELAAPTLRRVIRYEADGDPYLHLPRLAAHQRLEGDKVPSRLPAPPGENVCADSSERGADESARDPDDPAAGADESALLYVAGSMEHVAGSRGTREAAAGTGEPPDESPPGEPSRESRKPPGGPAPPPTMTGVALIDEFFKANPPSPPRDVRRKAAAAVEELLDGKVPEDIIREALQRWLSEKPEYGAAIVPKLAFEIQNKRTRGPTRKSASPPKKVNYSPEEYQRGFRRQPDA